MLRRMSVPVVVMLLSAGCTYEAGLPAVPADHPANPQAEAAPVTVPSDVLTVREPVEQPQPMGMMHEGHH